MLVLSTFIPSKLFTKYLVPVTPFQPLEWRKYTLTHSDSTGQLFLSIGSKYDYGAINYKFRDEVLAEWVSEMGKFKLFGRVYVSGGEFDENSAKVRFLIFQKELSLALKAIIYGDQTFFTNYPWLLDAPIYIRFESIYPEYNQIAYYGTPRYYLYSSSQPIVS